MCLTRLMMQNGEIQCSYYTSIYCNMLKYSWREATELSVAVASYTCIVQVSDYMLKYSWREATEHSSAVASYTCILQVSDYMLKYSWREATEHSVAVASYTCILQVSDSNLGLVICYPDCILCDFLQPLQENCDLVPRIRRRYKLSVPHLPLMVIFPSHSVLYAQWQWTFHVTVTFYTDKSPEDGNTGKAKKNKVVPVLSSLSTTPLRPIWEWMYKPSFSSPRH
jgi:hypothetical protein